MGATHPWRAKFHLRPVRLAPDPEHCPGEAAGQPPRPGIDWQMLPDPLTVDDRTGEGVPVCDHSGYVHRPEYQVPLARCVSSTRCRPRRSDADVSVSHEGRGSVPGDSLCPPGVEPPSRPPLAREQPRRAMGGFTQCGGPPGTARVQPGQNRVSVLASYRSWVAGRNCERYRLLSRTP